jgi:hypothetical protein
VPDPFFTFSVCFVVWGIILYVDAYKRGWRSGHAARPPPLPEDPFERAPEPPTQPPTKPPAKVILATGGDIIEYRRGFKAGSRAGNAASHSVEQEHHTQRPQQWRPDGRVAAPPPKVEVRIGRQTFLVDAGSLSDPG